MKYCYLCDSENVKKIVDWGDYIICKCDDCKVFFSDPLPSEQVLTEYYQGFRYNEPENSNKVKLFNTIKAELDELFLLSANTERKNYLDYGGGMGSAYKAACEFNLNVYYYDIDKEARQYVSDTYGLSSNYVVDDIKNTDLSFDYIFSDNVIEHVNNPILLIRRMKAVLKTGGTIILKTPHGGNSEIFFYPLISVKQYFLKALKYNKTPIVIKSYFSRFWHCDPPRHIYSFSAINLKEISLKAGFLESDIRISYYKLPLFSYSLTEIFLNYRRYNSKKIWIYRLFILPLIPLEIISKLVQFTLVFLKILTPGGIILHLNK